MEEISFAAEYEGPPVPYVLPRALPIDINRIPLATEASLSVTPLTIPIAVPITDEKENMKNDNNNDAVNGVVSSPTSVIETTAAMFPDGSGEVATSSSLPPDFTSGDLRTSESFSSEFNLTSESRELDSFDRRESTSAEPVVPRLKKGACHRCLKGSRFTEKESCLVCEAKYCAGCVLRAMGSMPEGRKCVGCIGSPIDESKREKLGKCSRMLKRLLSSLEVQEAMKVEKYCKANQPLAEGICVNRKKLSQQELEVLQSCPNPPAKLKPGYFWYDKVSGFWGKEGHKPHLIISPNLSIGGALVPNASNGNTGILINNREITKKELQMLKWAGVQCAGNPHFWVNADGTYQEEGQRNIKGKIWGKPGIKLICSMLSLPVPPTTAFPAEERIVNTVNRHAFDYLEQRILQKVLLIGNQGSGTSTIFKQAKFLYKAVPFLEDERERIKSVIQSNIYTYLALLLEGRERFEEESLAAMRVRSSDGTDRADLSCSGTEYSLSPCLKAFSDWLLRVMASGSLKAIFPAATREYACLVEELWTDTAIQATYKRRSELEAFPDVASYFLERVVDISKVDYEPSDMDILYAEGITSSNGLESTEFSFPELTIDETNAGASDLQESFLRYQLIRLHIRGFKENCKWLDMLEDVRVVIFCIATSNYNEFYEDEDGVLVNKMMESKKLFETIITHQTFERMKFLLVLNKIDVLDKKLATAPLTLCEWFDDFKPVTSRHVGSISRSTTSTKNNDPSMAELAFHYIAVKFKKLYYSLTGEKLYVTCSNALNPESVDATLKYAREILKWEAERRELCGATELLAYSNEQSFSASSSDS